MKLIVDEKNKNLFKAAIVACNGLMEDMYITVNSEGMNLRGMDPSHISFANIQFKPSFFEMFNYDNNAFWLDIEDLNNVLRRMQEDDLLEFELDRDEDKHYFAVNLENIESRRFYLQIPKTEFEPPKEPDLKFLANVEVPSASFRLAIEDADIIGDKCFFELNKDKLIIRTPGEYNKAKYEYLHGERIKDTFKSIHAIWKLKEMAKAADFADIVELSMGNDMPIRLDYKPFPDPIAASISFLLAPRIEESD